MNNNIHETAEVFNVELADGAKIYKSAFVKNAKLGKDVKVGDFSRIENSFLEEMSIYKDLQ